MKQIFEGQWIFYIGILTALFTSIFCQLYITYYMLRIVKASEKLEEEKPLIMKEWIEEYIKEKQNIVNVTIFIDRKLQQLTIGKFKIAWMKHFSGQMLLFAVFLAGLGACKGIMEGKTLGQILPFYIISLLGMYFHFSMSGVMDLEGKKKIVQMNLTDFLQNGRLYLYTSPEAEREKEIEEGKNFFGEEEEKQLREMIREIIA